MVLICSCVNRNNLLLLLVFLVCRMIATSTTTTTTVTSSSSSIVHAMSPTTTTRRRPDRLLFGSCNSQHYAEQPLWDNIRARNASAFVWAGDAIYADDVIPASNLWQRKQVKQATPALLRQLYHQQRQVTAYRQLLETNITILGAIDDHE